MNHPYFINSPQASLPQNLTTQILGESTAATFHASLPGYAPTPLLELDGQARHLGVGKLYLKDEAHRFGLNAFKGLGASYAIHKLLEKDPDIPVFCTATDGNHGRAVAWSARLAGKEAHVFVPKETTAARIEAIRNEGAAVEQLNMNYDDTCTYAAKMSKKNGWQLVQDTASEGYEEIPALIKAGYITHFKELEESLHPASGPKVDVVFLQAGVGSWPAAAAWYYRNRYGKNAPKLVLVEPRESSGILESFRQGKRCQPTGKLNSIMAGLNCGIPSLTAWEILKASVDAAMEIPDSYAEEGMRKLYNSEADDPRVISGESGVGGYAGLLALLTDDRYAGLKKSLGMHLDSRILVYNTEGNTDPQNFEKIISYKYTSS